MMTLALPRPHHEEVSSSGPNLEGKQLEILIQKRVHEDLSTTRGKVVAALLTKYRSFVQAYTSIP